MKQGIALMGDPKGSTGDALRCFDRALALRRQLPVDDTPSLGYGLAACWLNRAEALMRLGAPHQIADAVASLDAALVLLRRLPLDADIRYPRRLAIAHQNRGLAMHAQGTIAAAITAFTDAIAVLDDDRAAAIDDRQPLLAAIWMNLANAHASASAPGSPRLARDAARHAIARVADREEQDPAMAEVGLNARHVLCRTIADDLEREASPSELVHEATDTVDDGLGLVARWEERGETRFRAVAADLFQFGVRVYARFQPQFLQEFVLEHRALDPSPRLRAERGSAD